MSAPGRPKRESFARARQARAVRAAARASDGRIAAPRDGRLGGGRRAAAAALLAAMIAACGGSGSNPFDLPPRVSNPAQSSGQKLSFEYFQRCIYPLLQAMLPININGVVTTNSCASAGCHDDRNGTGGALRLSAAVEIDLADPGSTPEVVRASEMYRNFYSAQGEAVIGAPSASRLLNKPLVRGVLHGGGLIFATEQDPNARRIAYWISRPMPLGQDEFSSAGSALFTPPDPGTGNCNTD
jgi:hypothetical protein